MFSLRRIAVASAITVLLAACQGASTYAPQVSGDEIQQEQQIQQQRADQRTLVSQQKQRRERLNKEERLHRVISAIAPTASTVCHEMGLSGQGSSCVFGVELADKGGVNAYADGNKVVVLPGLLEFAKTDEELAFVLSHELAHNMMRHPQKSQGNQILGTLLGGAVDMLIASQGVNSQGAFSKVGAATATLSFSPEFEREADYIGMYILARSGYDADKAPEFWRRMAERNPDAIYVSTTHPNNAERYVAMQKTVREIADKRHRGVVLLPEKQTEDTENESVASSNVDSPYPNPHNRRR